MGITRGAQQVLAVYLHYTWSVHTKSYSTLIYIYYRPTSKTSKVFIFHLWIKLTSPVFLYLYTYMGGLSFCISLSSNSLPRLQTVILFGDHFYSIILAILFSTIILATTPTTELSLSI